MMAHACCRRGGVGISGIRNDTHRIDKSFNLEVLVKLQSERIPVLVAIKLLHTAIWLFFAECIGAIPFAGARRQFLWVAVLTGLVLVECAVLAVNRSRCPLTDLAVAAQSSARITSTWLGSCWTDLIKCRTDR
jgi:hypothetical protein